MGASKGKGLGYGEQTSSVLTAHAQSTPTYCAPITMLRAVGDEVMYSCLPSKKS